MPRTLRIIISPLRPHLSSLAIELVTIGQLDSQLDS